MVKHSYATDLTSKTDAARAVDHWTDREWAAVSIFKGDLYPGVSIFAKLNMFCSITLDALHRSMQQLIDYCRALAIRGHVIKFVLPSE